MALSLEKGLWLFLLCHFCWLVGLAPALDCGFFEVLGLHPSTLLEFGKAGEFSCSP